jgi:hypothetical protein
MNLEEAIEELGGLLEPTLDEKRNGWSAESLTVYHAERKKTAHDTIVNPAPTKPTQTTSGMKWL